MAVKRITAPLTDDAVRDLHAGDAVEISGVVYQARDAAHKRLVALIEAGEELPFDLQGAVVYYMGPSPAKPGNVIGSAGPTTRRPFTGSHRSDETERGDLPRGHWRSRRPPGTADQKGRGDCL